MRVLVCGPRDLFDFHGVSYVLGEIDSNISCLIEGGARGTDSDAHRGAKLNNIPIETYTANWTLYGKAAGYLRNKEMLEKGQPGLIVAFRREAQWSRGTKMMVDLAKTRVPVIVAVQFPTGTMGYRDVDWGPTPSTDEPPHAQSTSQ